jgi:hypothetical protein
VKKLGCALMHGTVATALLILLPGEGHAGKQSLQADCGFYSGGGGYCKGNFLGFRHHIDKQAYAKFRVGDDPYEFQIFNAQLNSASYSCVAGAFLDVYNNEWNVLWALAMTGQGYFKIEWNNYGYCNHLYIETGSEWSNF